MLTRPVHDKLKDEFAACIPDELMEVLRAFPDAYISGGMIRDFLTYHRYKDIDVFGLDQTNVIRAAQMLRELSGDCTMHHGKGTINCKFTSSAHNTDGGMLMFAPFDVQFLCIETHPGTSQFDIRCCTSAHNGREFLHISSLALRGQIGLRTPSLGTLARMLKLIERGWKATVQEVHAAAAVADLNLPHHS